MGKIKLVTIGFGALLVLSMAPAWAQDDQDRSGLDAVEMGAVSEPDGDEAAYVEEIVLPDEAALEAQESAAFGIDTANEARERAAEEGREFGRSTAQEARELGRDSSNAARAGGASEDRPVEVR